MGQLYELQFIIIMKEVKNQRQIAILSRTKLNHNAQIKQSQTVARKSNAKENNDPTQTNNNELIV